ncbi:MAG TPA: FtsQ-type POTRA domain-containing protein [Ktedonobacteraceae bacterium]
MNSKREPEQITLAYRDHRSSSVARRASASERRREIIMSNTGEYRQHSQSKRNVSTPELIEQPATWAERHSRYTRPTAPRTARRQVQRTLARTGMAAPEGPVRIVKPLPRPYTPIPARSGAQKRRRTLWGRFLTIFALVALAMAALGFALFSPTFYIGQVTVKGTGNATLVHSIQHMGMLGQNIFLIDIAGFSSRVDALPLVSSANIEKDWPNALTVSVVERQPVLLWQTPRATYSVDSHGVVIGLASETAGADHLMTVVDMRSKEVIQRVQPGTQLNAADIAFARQVFARLPGVAGISAFTLRYDAANSQSSSSGSFIVQSPQGWIAYLGGADDTNPLDNRLVELQQILNTAQQQQLTLATIDLRYGLRPVFTVKTS